MKNSTESHQAEEGIRIDVLKTLDTYGRAIVRIALITTALVAAAGAAYLFWWQPSLRTAALEFRPTFAGAASGKYPNELPFSGSDVTAATVLDQVFDANGIQQYCERDVFKSAFFVEQRSAQYAFLDAEFQARLADTRLSAVDRERIQQEYRARRAAMPVQFQLVFASAGSCADLPTTLISKSLYEVLNVWARQSENRRGVLRMQTQILTPSALDIGLADGGARLIRADLIRTALSRLVRNVQVVEDLPGADLIRLPSTHATFTEVRSKLEDLIDSRLEPLVVMAGRSMGAESLSWANEALASATQERDRAEGRVETYLRGLQVYSGTMGTPAPTTDNPGASRSSDVQALTPQIDRTFVDRLLEMSEPNTIFRQEMTREMVAAGVEAVDSRAKVAYYEHLLSALRGPGSAGLSSGEVDARLDEVVRDGKDLARQFNALYDEWSKVSLRPAGAMFETDRPVTHQVVQPFSRTAYLLTVIAALLISVMTTAVIFLGRDQLQEARTRRRARLESQA